MEKKTQNFNINNISYNIRRNIKNMYLFHRWINKLCSVENKVPRTLFEAWKVAGSAT